MSHLKLYFIAGICVMLLAGLSYFIHDQRERGAQVEAAKQEKENAKFQVNARRGAVEFDVCDRADGLYNFAKGTCKLP